MAHKFPGISICECLNAVDFFAFTFRWIFGAMPGFLVPLLPSGSSERIELQSGETTLGRKSTCSIVASLTLERFWIVSLESPKKCTNCVVNFLIWSFIDRSKLIHELTVVFLIVLAEVCQEDTVTFSAFFVENLDEFDFFIGSQVSGVHCKIFSLGGNFELEDTSRNGTLWNDQRLQKDRNKTSRGSRQSLKHLQNVVVPKSPGTATTSRS